MKRLTWSLLIAVALASGVASAETRCTDCGTTVTNSWIENATWTEAGSPYCVDLDITVNQLTIEPGVCVRVGAGHRIEAYVLHAVGMESAPIIFTAADSATGWGGLRFQDQGAGSELLWCRFEHAKASALTLINSTPVVQHCIFTDNHRTGNGGGIYARVAAGDLLLEDCTISNNTSTEDGGGIYAETVGDTLRLLRCTVSGNTASKNTGVSGGGLAIVGNASIRHSEISSNTAYSDIFYTGNNAANGGGIYSSSGLLVLVNSIVSSNTVLAHAADPWGSNPSYTHGAGVYLASGAARLRNTILSCNVNSTAWYNYGSGIFVGDSAQQVLLENCTIARNGIEGIYCNQDTVVARNTIVYFNNNSGKQFSGPVRFTFSDVQGDTVVAGEGNVRGAPNFHGAGCSVTDLTIGQGVACVDTGDPSTALNDGCLPPGLGGARNDMGAHGGPGNCGWVTPPPAPTALAAQSIPTAVTLTWAPVTDPYLNGYRIFRETTTGPTTLLGSVGKESVSFMDTSGDAGTQYYYRLCAFSILGEAGEYSNEVCATRQDLAPPSVPSAPQLSVDPDRITVSWQRGLDCDLAAYRLYRGISANPANLTLVGTLSTAVVHYVDTQVTGGPTYYYQLRFVDNAGNEGTGSSLSNATLPAADLGVTVHVSDPEPSVNGQTVFTITASNIGPDSATAVSVSVTRPARLTFVSSQPSLGSFNGTVWTLPHLLAGASDSLVITAKATQRGADSLVAAIHANEPTDPNPSNDRGRALFFARQTDLALVKTVDNAAPEYHSQVHFRVLLSNRGPDAAKDITVTDSPSPGLQVGTVIVSDSTTYDVASGHWLVPSLAVGDTATLAMPAVISRVEPDTNRAVITAATPSDPSPANNSAQAIVRVPQADLRVRMSVSNPTPIIGRDVDFAVTVENLGPGSAAAITVGDTLPSGLELRSSSYTSGTTYSGGLWTIPNLASGQSASLNIKANVHALPDTCTARLLASTPLDPNPANNRQTVLLREGAADLALDMTVNQPTPLHGDKVTFTVALTNNGGDTAYEVAVKSLLVDGLTFASANVSPGSYSASSGVWTVGTLQAGHQGTLSIQANTARVGAFTHRVEIATSGVTDPTSTNDRDSVVVQVRPAADLSVTAESQPDTTRIGSAASFIVRVANAGPSAATNIKIDDPIPVGLTSASTTASLGIYAGGQWSISVLPDGSTATLTLVVSSDVEGAFTNIATVAACDQGDRVTTNNSASSPIRFVASPEIQPVMPEVATEATDVEIRAHVADNTGIANVSLRYRRASLVTELQTPMSAVGGGTYRGVIPAGSVRADGLVLSICATDLDGNRSCSDPFAVVVQSAGVTNTVAQPCGSTAGNYRMVSVPLALADSTPGAVLIDDLGPYEPAQWRFFGLQADQSYAEYPNTEAMTPGRAFWLTVKECGRVVDTGTGHGVAPDAVFTIPVHSKWNFIANPFVFPIPIESIRLRSAHPVALMRYVGEWQGVGAGEFLAPFAGFALFADLAGGDTLLCSPDPTPRQSAQHVALAGRQWAIRIRGQIGGAADGENFAVADRRASATWDLLDLPEPPVIGEYVSISFPHPEWRALASNFRTDSRPEIGDGAVWSLSVSTNLRGRLILRFDELSSVPAEYSVAIIDPRLGVGQDLRALPQYEFLAAPDVERDLSLVVGHPAFVDAQMTPQSQRPNTCVLYPSLPNPFTSMTTIRFGLPTSDRVTLQLFNVSGQLVATLLESAPRPAGNSAVVWDGRDRNGRPVAAGVYLFRLRSTGRTVEGRTVKLGG